MSENSEEKILEEKAKNKFPKHRIINGLIDAQDSLRLAKIPEIKTPKDIKEYKNKRNKSALERYFDNIGNLFPSSLTDLFKWNGTIIFDEDDENKDENQK